MEKGSEPHLKRTLTLPLLVLYGLGVTIGAGIYVLVGATVGRAGIHAPLSFVLAALVMAPSACAFAEMACRYPVSAGEAAYVRAGLASAALAVLVGLLVVGSGVVSAATVSIGAVGYLRVFIDVPQPVLVPLVVLAMGGVAAWGILQSVTLAAIFTLIEIGGLLLIIGGGLTGGTDAVADLGAILPSMDSPAPWIGIAGAGLLAFFAFVGFEDMVNVAEEVKRPERTMPAAIFLTLAVSTLMYVLVVTVAVLRVPVDELAASTAPLGLVFERVTGLTPALISAIAVVATLNGVIVQIIMASRVLYGLACQGSLPALLRRVNPVTQTPLLATALVVGIVLLLAMAFPLEGLAETTSRFTLSVFALVNVALLNLKRRGVPAPPGSYTVPAWVPFVGVVSCVLLLSSDFL